MNLILLNNDGFKAIAQFENIWWRKAIPSERELFLGKYSFLGNLEHPADADYQLIVLFENAPLAAIDKTKKFVRVNYL